MLKNIWKCIFLFPFLHQIKAESSNCLKKKMLVWIHKSIYANGSLCQQFEILEFLFCFTDREINRLDCLTIEVLECRFVEQILV